MIARSFDDGPSSDDLDLDQLSAHSRGALAEFRVPASGSRIRCGLNGITLALHRKIELETDVRGQRVSLCDDFGSSKGDEAGISERLWLLNVPGADQAPRRTLPSASSVQWGLCATSHGCPSRSRKTPEYPPCQGSSEFLRVAHENSPLG